MYAIAWADQGQVHAGEKAHVSGTPGNFPSVLLGHCASDLERGKNNMDNSPFFTLTANLSNNMKESAEIPPQYYSIFAASMNKSRIKAGIN